MLKLVLVFFALVAGNPDPVVFTTGVSQESYATEDECKAAAKGKVEKVAPGLAEILNKGGKAQLHSVEVSCVPADQVPAINSPAPKAKQDNTI